MVANRWSKRLATTDLYNILEMTKLEMENRLVVARGWGLGVWKGGGCSYKRVARDPCGATVLHFVVLEI